MINIKELERRWLKYKAKSVLLFGSIISIFSALIYGGYYILFELDFNSKDNREKIVLDKNLSSDIKQPIKLVEKNSSDIEKKHNLDIDNKQLMLTPIIPIIEDKDDKNIHRDTTVKAKKRNNRRKIKRAYRVKKLKPKLKTEHKVEHHVKKVNFHKEESSPKIDLKMTSSNYMTVMKEKFLKNKNPRDAILIAKAYFRAGNFEKSKEWSLKANSLDNSLEESWILFAKSKQMLGEGREALKILITYYKKSKSKRVRDLIEKMKTESI